MQWPFSNTLGVGAAILAVSVAVIALFTTGLGPILIGGAALALLLYVGYVVAVNIHRWSTTRYDRGGRS